MKKFERLANEVESQIRKGVLRPGERLPSVREMSRDKRVSINTVLSAYELLERKGLLITKPQSGFYVFASRIENSLRPAPRMSNLPVDIKIPELLGVMIDSVQERNTVQLGAATLSSELCPTDDINKIMRQVLRDSPDAASVYQLSPGDYEYRRQVSKLLSKTTCHVSPEEILATNGAAEAVSLALRAVCKRGDTVVTESPQFFGILQVLKGHGLRVIELRTNPGTGVDLNHLQDVLKINKVAAAVLVPNFHNPLGYAMSDASKKDLVELFTKHNIPVIEDDVYADLQFQGTRPTPLKAFDRSDTVITCSSFSKTVAAGLRIGWIATGRFHKDIRNVQLSSSMAAGTVSQKVMAKYLGSKACENHFRKLRLRCSVHTTKATQQVLQTFPEGTRVSQPQGGFVLWVELPKRIDSVELYTKALGKNVTFSPGVLFSAKGRYRNFLRLNCGNMWNERVETAIGTLGQLAKRF